ncbi:hypothetical protein HC028_08655 [Planosporangium flavigriseum]|uniref:Uncharacterized protein n=1 Tax=Planosporangium flavigriseum TaxID=373681 RepID=A0A8J3PKI5_9ACTN|nr:hypothetical protein [Planosporangium flavigriseum]NJC64574.1 hypothetical protein [Planosporangium flavigriseum]GIG71943.1 hypothetical protein Pfl04_03470 [Planosporangium flavigriseum]
MGRMDDFYEPDEPVEEILRAFEQGEKGVTSPVTWAKTEYLKLPGLASLGRILSCSSNKTTPQLSGN